MENKIIGLHHITAVASDAQQNYDYYTKVLGQRLVKKTVNFDDPGTYHFYFGTEKGTPGTIMTFFPWTHMKRGVLGAGQPTEIYYSIPVGSTDFWLNRLNNAILSPSAIEGKNIIRAEDPDGLKFSLVEVENDSREAWTTNEISAANAIRGFYGMALTVQNASATKTVLSALLNYSEEKVVGNTTRFLNMNTQTANVVDVIERPELPFGKLGAGINHHVAFRVKDEETLMFYREKIENAGLNITPKIDRNYFFSLYFREPGGVLFEIATDNPGFDVDEPLESLGQELKLPQQYEVHRDKIESVLPKLNP